MKPPRLMAAIRGKTPANNPGSPWVRQTPCRAERTFPPAVLDPAFANMILVFATSRGVVTTAANPPAKAPQTADCQDSTT